MSVFFLGEPDPREVTATYLGAVEQGEEIVLRVAVEDGTDAPGGEIKFTASATTACTHSLDQRTIENLAERFANGVGFPPAARLRAVLAEFEVLGAYRIERGERAGLYVAKPPLRRVAA